MAAEERAGAAGGPGDGGLEVALRHLALADNEPRPWLGFPTFRLAEDLLALAEALHAVRPKVVVLDTPVGRGGLGMFAASVLDAVSFGQVFAVADRVPQHRRLRAFRTTEKLLGQMGYPGFAAPVLAVVGGSDADAVEARLRAWAPYVTSGSYLLVEETVREVLAGGPGGGPWEAIDRFVPGSCWAIDRNREGRYSRNPGGWLLRGCHDEEG